VHSDVVVTAGASCLPLPAIRAASSSMIRASRIKTDTFEEEMKIALIFLLGLAVVSAIVVIDTTLIH
jgi:hypothetical protein